MGYAFLGAGGGRIDTMSGAILCLRLHSIRGCKLQAHSKVLYGHTGRPVWVEAIPCYSHS